MIVRITTSMAFRFVVSVVLLVIAWVAIGGTETLARFATVEAEWVVLAIGLSVPQLILSAVRWRFTATRLGARLETGEAVSEYYVSTFVNQVVPGGVTGDVLRAWRHVRRVSEDIVPWGTIARAVLFERAAGQVVLLIVMAAGLAAWPTVFGTAPPSWLIPAVGILVGATILATAIGRVVHKLRSKGGETAVSRFVADAKAALLAPRVLPIQFGLSSLIVATYLVTYWCCGQALGTNIPPIAVITVVPAVLMAMLLPVSIAGWGLREMAAAALWPLAGMAASDGIAIATLYGLVVLAGSLPGAFLVRRRAAKIELEHDILPHGDGPTGRPQGVGHAGHGGP